MLQVSLRVFSSNEETQVQTGQVASNLTTFSQQWKTCAYLLLFGSQISLFCTMILCYCTGENESRQRKYTDSKAAYEKVQHVLTPTLHPYQVGLEKHTHDKCSEATGRCVSPSLLPPQPTIAHSPRHCQKPFPGCWRSPPLYCADSAQCSHCSGQLCAQSRWVKELKVQKNKHPKGREIRPKHQSCQIRNICAITNLRVDYDLEFP